MKPAHKPTADGRYTLVLKLSEGQRQEFEANARAHGLKLWQWALMELLIASHAHQFREGTGLRADQAPADPRPAQPRRRHALVEPDDANARSAAEDGTEIDVDALVAGRLDQAEQAGLTAPRPQEEPDEADAYYAEGGVRPLHAVSGPFQGQNRPKGTNIARSSMRGGR